LAITENNAATQAKTVGTELSRFNALRHGVLSRYTVLPWEDANEYRGIVAALAAEHAPQGPTEEHLVEEIAGILWRKRRLRLAEAAAHRRGLERTLESYRETVKVALVHLDTPGKSERVVDAIRATAADTEEDMADMAADEAMTRRAIELLGSKRNDAYKAALAELRENTQALVDGYARPRSERTCGRAKVPPPPMSRASAASSKARFCRGSKTGRRRWPTDPSSASRPSARLSIPTNWSGSVATRFISTGKLERMLAMLLRLKDLRQATGAG
jgi:hypothetical protein